VQVLFVLGSFVGWWSVARADEPLTIPLTVEAAVAEALERNVHVPLAQTDVAIAQAHIAEVEGERWPTLGIEGHLHGGYPSTYASGDARLQLVGTVPIVDASASAEVRAAKLAPAVAEAEVAIQKSDLAREVRTVFAEILALESEIALRDAGLERLQAYVDLVSVRQRAGDPVAGDVLRARAQQSRSEAERAGVEGALRAAEISLNGLLGHAPDDRLVLAPLPDPTPPSSVAQAWRRAPELLGSDADIAEAAAEIAVAKGGFIPTVDLLANAGAEPVLGSSFDAPANTGRGVGVEGMLELAWPLWNHGATRAQVSQAELTHTQAQQSKDAVAHDVELAWSHARQEVDHLAQQVAKWRQLEPLALDATLYAESLYRGGAGSGLDVMDAYDAWMEAGLSSNEATFAYRRAEAELARWEGR